MRLRYGIGEKSAFMKQVGIMLLVMAVLGLVAQFFQLQGTFWDALITVLVMGTSAFIPKFKQVLAWKIHWRLALGVAVVCTFVLLWQLMRRVMGDYQTYSLAATLIVLSLFAFLFHYLDTRDSNGGR